MDYNNFSSQSWIIAIEKYNIFANINRKLINESKIAYNSFSYFCRIKLNTPMEKVSNWNCLYLNWCWIEDEVMVTHKHATIFHQCLKTNTVRE